MNKVFITGGCGFIGSHLAELFVSKNFKVTVYDKYNIQNDLNNLTESKYLKKYYLNQNEFSYLKKYLKYITSSRYNCKTIKNKLKCISNKTQKHAL